MRGSCFRLKYDAYRTFNHCELYTGKPSRSDRISFIHKMTHYKYFHP